MYRIKDFILMNVINLEGKTLGTIRDVLLDFNKKEVIGFVVSEIKSFSQKAKVILKEDIVYYNKDIIVKEVREGEYFSFESIKYMDVVTKRGDILGLVKDIIFEEEDFKIKALVLSKGFLKDFIEGKRIILISKIIIGDKNILNYGRENLTLNSKPHKRKLFGKEGGCYEIQ